MSLVEQIAATFSPNYPAQGIIVLFFLVLTRILTISLVSPVLGGQLLPGLVRIGLTGVLGLIMVSLNLAQSHDLVDLDWLVIGGLIVKEAIIGLILGFFSSLIFFAYDTAGQLLDFARAANMGQLLVPHLRKQSSSMGTFLFQFAVVMFFVFDLHHGLIKNIAQSFVSFPLSVLVPKIEINNWFFICIDMLLNFFQLAFSISMPIIFVCFLIDLTFGLLNRVAPQINAYFLSLPAKIAGGLTMVFFILPLLVDEFLEQVTRLTNIWLGLLG